MKRKSKKIAKDEINEIQKKDSIFTKDVISLNDKENKQYLDDFVYKVYLINLNGEDGDTDEK